MSPRTTSRRPARPRRGGGAPMLRNNPFGLTVSEVSAEVRRCLARGWLLWEIRQRFTRGDS